MGYFVCWATKKTPNKQITQPLNKTINKDDTPPTQPRNKNKKNFFCLFLFGGRGDNPINDPTNQQKIILFFGFLYYFIFFICLVQQIKAMGYFVCWVFSLLPTQ